MRNKNFSKLVVTKLLMLAVLTQILPVITKSAAAKKPHPHKHRTNSSQNNNYSHSASLNQIQRANLVNILQGRDRDFDLSPAIRVEIDNGVSSLPPGIQKKLNKGKRLPPGIAKKTVLPKAVNRHLNISSDATIIAIGSSVVIINPQNIILDVLHSIF